MRLNYKILIYFLLNRHSAKKIVLEVQRPRALEPVAKSSPRKPLSSTLRNLHHHYHHHHPDSGAHSDSELEENVRNKLTLGGCGTLPRKRVTFKVRCVFFLLSFISEHIQFLVI